MNSESVLVALGSVILTGGFVSGVASFRKSKPESAQIMVNAARDVVLIQKSALEDYQRRLDEMERRFDEQDEMLKQGARTAAIALAECNAERREFRHERDAERIRNAELLERIEHLESEVARLSKVSDQDHKPTTPREQP